MQPPPKGQFQAGVPVQQASGYDPKAQAIGNLGQAVKQSGDLALELQKEQDRQYLTDAEIIMRREAGRIANELATTMDPTQHYSKAKDKFDSVVKGILQKGDFRPSFQNELQGRLNMFTSAKLEKIAHDAKVMQLENGKMLHIAKAKSFQADGDFDGARNVLDEGVGTYWPEEYAKAKKLEIDRMERNEELYVIAKEGKPELFDKEEFKSESDRDKWKSIAKEQNRKTTIAKADQVFEDIIGGKDITVEDIEKMEDLKPSVRQKLKNTILDLHDDEMRQMMKDPAYRDQVRGEVAALIANYNPSGEDFDNDFVEIRNKIELLPSGPLKSEFIGQLGNIRAGKEREIKDVRDWTMAQVDEAYKEGKLGVKAPEEPKGRTIKSYLASGDLLRNEDNLVKFGFKDEHAAEIVKAAIAEDEKDKTYKGQSSEYLFQKYYYDGGEATGDYSYRLRAAYEALIGGAGPSAVVIDPADQKAYESKVQDFENDSFGMYGRAKSEVADFLKMNPSPSMEKATEFLKGLKVNIEAGATNSDWLKDKPKPMTGKEVSSVDLPSKLAPLADDFVKYGKQYGVDPRFLSAISRLETANGTSSAFRNKNNAMGVSNAKGPISFSSASQSIERMARVLSSKKGPYGRATTLKEIARIYAPPGAGNDPNGTNSYWPRGVAKYLRQMGIEDPYNQSFVAR